MTAPRYLSLVSDAADELKSRRDEIDRLNVFPVPDGDTGTNMSLTMSAVLADVAALPSDASVSQICQAITHGSLMGARGNSGVILSQVLRGLCEVVGAQRESGSALLATALERAVEVAFHAVRKPVEGTMLTVLRDTASAARDGVEAGLPLDDALQRITEEAYRSVERTPSLLPVLKENGVVDAGGLGLAVLLDGFTRSFTGTAIERPPIGGEAGEPVRIRPADDWDDDEYLYCTEFLLYGDDIDREQVLSFVSSMGGSELVVGERDLMKVHVHTNEPGVVLAHMTGLGEVAEVHINNMRRQQAARDETLRAAGSIEPSQPLKTIGFVTVAAGAGLAAILRSLGADVVVTGGQTMNPSTKELLDAIESLQAEKVVVLPNNKNVVMSATAAAASASKPAVVVPTTAVPQAFAALLAYDGQPDIEAVAADMSAAASSVRAGEVTTAVRDAKGKAGDIHAGQVIGIAEHEIEIVGEDVIEVSTRLAEHLATGDTETLTVLAGEDLSNTDLEALAGRLGEELPDVEVETHRGDQPVYPVILAAE
jgi:DAK2 domain fusion protein YloV